MAWTTPQITQNGNTEVGWIISGGALPDVEVRNHLNELEWLNLVKEALPRPSHAEFRLWNVTEKGLQDRSSQDHT